MIRLKDYIRGKIIVFWQRLYIFNSTGKCVGSTRNELYYRFPRYRKHRKTQTKMHKFNMRRRKSLGRGRHWSRK